MCGKKKTTRRILLFSRRKEILQEKLSVMWCGFLFYIAGHADLLLQPSDYKMNAQLLSHSRSFNRI